LKELYTEYTSFVQERIKCSHVLANEVLVIEILTLYCTVKG